MKLAVVGSRNFTNYKVASEVINNLRKEYNITSLVSGGANGADKLAERYAEEYNMSIEIYKPDWDKFGKSAGFIRNQTIWDNSDLGVAFWDGKSKGTAHSFEIAKKQKKFLRIVKPKEK